MKWQIKRLTVWPYGSAVCLAQERRFLWPEDYYPCMKVGQWWMWCENAFSAVGNWQPYWRHGFIGTSGHFWAGMLCLLWWNWSLVIIELANKTINPNKFPSRTRAWFRDQCWKWISSSPDLNPTENLRLDLLREYIRVTFTYTFLLVFLILLCKFIIVRLLVDQPVCDGMLYKWQMFFWLLSFTNYRFKKKRLNKTHIWAKL